MIRKVQQIHVTIAILVAAFTHILAKWLVGVAIQKLIVHTTGNVFSVSGSALYEFVLLQHLSFHQTACYAVAVILLTSVSSATMSSMALLVGAETGRKLREQLLHGAVSISSAGSSLGMEQHAASELIHKAKIIENFQAYDDHFLLFNYIVIFLAFLFSFVFNWYASLLALVILVCSESIGALTERARLALRKRIDENAQQVDARLLDVIKNGERIKTMDMSAFEAERLRTLENESNEARKRDALVRMAGFSTKLSLLGCICIGMPLIAWPILDNLPLEEAASQGFGILFALLLMDEGHKGLLYIHDKK